MRASQVTYWGTYMFQSWSCLRSCTQYRNFSKQTAWLLFCVDSAGQGAQPRFLVAYLVKTIEFSGYGETKTFRCQCLHTPTLALFQAFKSRLRLRRKVRSLTWTRSQWCQSMDKLDRTILWGNTSKLAPKPVVSIDNNNYLRSKEENY